MSTCFLPVADDLRVGDVIVSACDVTLATPKTVASKTTNGDALVVTFTDGSMITVRPDADVTIAPPF